MKYATLLSLLILPALSACKTTPDEYGLGDPVKPLTQHEQIMVSARNAALESQYRHIEKGALSNAEKQYRNVPNAQNAMRYTNLLRQVNMVHEAQMILKPFAIDPTRTSPKILNEYAKIKLSLGDFEQAQIFAQEAMTLDEMNAESQMLLGISVDAQGHHQAAENHFQQALIKSKLNPELQSTINNNLALSLLGQGKNDAANAVLQKIHGSSLQQNTVIDANKSFVKKL
jgi:Flp pilus assembly protein TadD